MKTGICVLKSMEMESLETCRLPDLRTFPSFRLTNNKQPTTNHQLRRFLLMILITLNSLVSIAQNITVVEYFFDSDPGYGFGTSVAITPATSITNFTFPIDITAASDGFHALFVRAKDANNNWSAAYSRPFYKLSATTFAPVPNVNKLEYFIDSDPGYGLGVDVPVTPAVSIPNIGLTASLTAIAEGSHVITFRARDANNNWSVVAIKNFSKCNHPGTTVSTATAITSSGFTASWADVTGSISYRLDVSTDNFNTFVSGYNAKVITAPALSSVVTGLAQATTYQYRVRAVASCTSVESNAVSLTTFATPPSAQPTSLLFSSVTSTSLTAFFTAPTTAPTGYLVVRKIGSATSFVPATNTSYTLNQNIGDGIVAYIGPTFLFNETGLAPDTNYFYSVFAYNQVSTSISYLTTSPLQNNVRTVALEPTAQPTGLQFASVTDVGFTVSYTAATGSPTGYLVLRKTSSAPVSVPVDGTTYTTTVGTDAVVYNGAATTFAQTGLTQNTQSFYAVYSYNGTGTAINYLATAPLQGSQLTPITPPTASPTNLIFSNVTPSTMTVTYTAAAGSPTGYLVIRKVGGSAALVPQTNVAYTAGQTLTDGVVAYVGSALTFNESGLAPSTTYFYDVFAYNQISALIGYRTSSPLEGSKSTFTAEPTAQASALVFTSTTTNAHTVSFTAASPAPTGYLVLRKASSAPTSLPIDGTAYSLSNLIGDGTVAFIGSAITFTDSGLLPGTTYHYQLFSFNGSAAATNYLTTVTASNSGSKITVPAKAATPTAATIGQNQFTINWAATTGADTYRLDVSKDNFATRVSGYDDLTVNALTQQVTGLETGIAYKFRIRSVNTSGTSVNSDEVQQFTIPTTPVLAAATGVGQFGFTANWNLTTGATNYFMDVSLESDFSTFAAGYQNKQLSIVNSEVVTGLVAGNTYYYRIRSKNDGGTSPSSSTVNQLLIPATPVGADGTNQQSNSFKANWQPAQGASSYLLDVSLASTNFNPSLPNYTDRPIPFGTAEIVSNLSSSTEYRYRIKAVNASGTSPSSIPVPVSTTAPSTGTLLELTMPAISSEFIAPSVNVPVTVKGGTPGYTLVFYHRKITGSVFTAVTLTATGLTYTAVVDASMLDEIGVEFYFKVTDAIGASVETPDINKRFMYVAVPSSGQKIPFTKFGGTKESYELFSIPYELAKNGASDIFDELGAIDKSKWRLSRYQNGKNIDVGAGLTAIEQGKGYWFNRKENIEVFFSNGTITKANQSTPFKLILESGWNQVGNPFPFNVDWDDIVALSPSKSQIGKLKVFNAEQFTLTDESNNLKAWSGGFVFNSSDQRIELELPVTLKNTAGGRKATPELLTSDLSKPEWFVPLTITQGTIANYSTGFGMHPEANLLKDQYDDMVVPRFINYLEFYTTHTDYFSPWFSRDVVSTSASHSWDFSFESNLSGSVELQWSKEELGMNLAQLFLFDPTAGILLDMKKLDRYRFEPKSKQTIKVFYGASEKEVAPNVDALTAAWPNPFSKETNISFVVKDKESKVAVSVFDLMGKKIYQLVNGVYDAGVYSAQWVGTDFADHEVAVGLYILLVEINGFTASKRIIKK
jgi:hypothetical protein